MNPTKVARGPRDAGRPLRNLRICILHVPDCPLVGRVRADVESALAGVGATAVIEDLEGPYPSPTLLIDGVDATGQSFAAEPTCRLDLPTKEQIAGAILAARVATAS